jgi:hypothetical protein
MRSSAVIRDRSIRAATEAAIAAAIILARIENTSLAHTAECG